jgi:hypothetical protein
MTVFMSEYPSPCACEGVVEVEAAQKILVGLSAAGVLGGDHSRHGFHDLPVAQDRAGGEFIGAHGPLRGRGGNSDHAILPPLDHDFGQMDWRLIGGGLIDEVLGVGVDTGRQHGQQNPA